MVHLPNWPTGAARSGGARPPTPNGPPLRLLTAAPPVPLLLHLAHKIDDERVDAIRRLIMRAVAAASPPTAEAEEAELQTALDLSRMDAERLSRSGQKVRDYLVFDASLIYELDQWRAMLRVDNLFDETYAASGFIDRTGHFPGAPRSVFIELTRHW